jgi:hypothetical protein
MERWVQITSLVCDVRRLGAEAATLRLRRVGLPLALRPRSDAQAHLQVCTDTRAAHPPAAASHPRSAGTRNRPAAGGRRPARRRAIGNLKPRGQCPAARLGFDGWAAVHCVLRPRDGIAQNRVVMLCDVCDNNIQRRAAYVITMLYTSVWFSLTAVSSSHSGPARA